MDTIIDIFQHKSQLKAREVNQWQQYIKEQSLHKKAPQKSQLLTEKQLKLFPFMNKYYDMLFTNRNLENEKELMKLYALHALNHIVK